MHKHLKNYSENWTVLRRRRCLFSFRNFRTFTTANNISIKTQSMTSFRQILNYTNRPRLYLTKTAMAVQPVWPRTANKSLETVISLHRKNVPNEIVRNNIKNSANMHRNPCQSVVNLQPQFMCSPFTVWSAYTAVLPPLLLLYRLQ